MSQFPRTDPRVGASFFLSAGFCATALVLASWHFTRQAERTKREREGEGTNTTTSDPSTAVPLE